MNTDDVKRLRALCLAKSKHSSYQIIHPIILKLIDLEDLNISGKSEIARQKYFEKVLDYREATILDIGANTGYFSFSAVDCGATLVDCYEGNTAHAEFLRSASSLLGLENRIQVFDNYFSFDGNADKVYDIAFCLNVLHHLGDDFGDQLMNLDEVKETMSTSLNNLAEIAKIVVFQMGFNWKGRRELPLFETGTKGELIDYVGYATKDVWNIAYIGIAENQGNYVAYSELNGMNIWRDDSLGEFLNRPIFILKSLR